MNDISKEDNYTFAGYVNSKDIREYLREIGYSFTVQEVAWLIWQCEHLTLKEKRDAWQNLMDREFLDRETPLVLTICAEPQKLWDFLCRYMEIEMGWLERFMDPENSVYHFSIRFTHRDDAFEYVDDRYVFSNYEDCLEAAKKEVSDYDDQEKKNLKVRITRRRIDSKDGPYHSMSVYLDPNYEILEVEASGTPEEESYTHITFEEMWFDFPVPFKKGDIIYDTVIPEDWPYGGPMVLEECAPDHYAKKGRRGCDNTDMWVQGYFRWDGGTIYQESSWNYMNYEYYPVEKLTGKKRVLPVVSRYLKGEIGLCCMLNFYHQVLTEETAADCNPCSKMIKW